MISRIFLKKESKAGSTLTVESVCVISVCWAFRQKNETGFTEAVKYGCWKTNQ